MSSSGFFFDTSQILCVMDSYPEQYLEGLRLFTEEAFFEAHEILEELWQETLGDERKFYQGLIQAAVALFHFGNQNYGGARKVYGTSSKYLERYGEFYGGIPLGQFLQDFKFCFQELLDSPEACPTHIVLRDERISKIPLPVGTGE